MLAREYPIEPRPEWTEIVPEQDGFERELILSPNPVLDIQTKGHSNPAVYEAVVMLFSDPTNPEIYPPHPARGYRDERFRIQSDSRVFLHLLIESMKGH